MRRESQWKWSQRIHDDDAVELTNVGLSRSPISSTDSPPPPHTRVIDRVENGDSNTVTAVEGKKNDVTQLPVKSDRAQSNFLHLYERGPFLRPLSLILFDDAAILTMPYGELGTLIHVMSGQ